MWQEIGQYVGGILGTAAAVALLTLSKYALDWLRAHISEQNQKMLGDAAEKLLTLGIMKLAPLIAERGWDSPEVKRALIQFGVDNIGEKFPDAKAYVEKFTDNRPLPEFGRLPTSDQMLRDVLERALPAASQRAVASPMTPDLLPKPTDAANTAIAAIAEALPAAPEPANRE